MKLLKKPILIPLVAGAGCYTWLLLSAQVAVLMGICTFVLFILARLWLNGDIRLKGEKYGNLIQTPMSLRATGKAAVSNINRMIAL